METLSQELFESLGNLDDPNGFSPHGLGERHGSLERTWARGSRGLMRFVIISATPEPEAGSNCYEMEVAIGADNGRSYIRKLFSRLPAVDLQSIRSADWREHVEAELGLAAKAAGEIEWHDLTSTRPVSADQGLATTRI